MRRKRFHQDTKVWRDPLVAPGRAKNSRDGSSRDADGRQNGRGAGLAELAEGAVETNRRRQRVEPAKRNGARIIAGPQGPSDPREIERVRLLDRVLAAEGRPSITRAVDDFIGAGFDLPTSQEVWLQVLEHNHENRVAEAIERLRHILGEEGPKRRAVLESRLRRIEAFADEQATQRAATELRRVLNTKYAETLG